MPTAARSFYRELSQPARDALIRVSMQQFRTPDQQVAKYVAEGLRREGAIPEDGESPAELTPAYDLTT